MKKPKRRGKRKKENTKLSPTAEMAAQLFAELFYRQITWEQDHLDDESFDGAEKGGI